MTSILIRGVDMTDDQGGTQLAGHGPAAVPRRVLRTPRLAHAPVGAPAVAHHVGPQPDLGNRDTHGGRQGHGQGSSGHGRRSALGNDRPQQVLVADSLETFRAGGTGLGYGEPRWRAGCSGGREEPVQCPRQGHSHEHRTRRHHRRRATLAGNARPSRRTDCARLPQAGTQQRELVRHPAPSQQDSSLTATDIPGNAVRQPAFRPRCEVGAATPAHRG